MWSDRWSCIFPIGVRTCAEISFLYQRISYWDIGRGMELDAVAHHCSRLNSAQITPVGEVNLDSSFNEAGRGNSIFCLSSMQPAWGLRGPDAEPVTDLGLEGAVSADLDAQPQLGNRCHQSRMESTLNKLPPQLTWPPSAIVAPAMTCSPLLLVTIPCKSSCLIWETVSYK